MLIIQELTTIWLLLRYLVLIIQNPFVKQNPDSVISCKTKDILVWTQTEVPADI